MCLGTLPTLTSSVSIILGSSGCKATFTFSPPGCPGKTGVKAHRASPLCHLTSLPARNKIQFFATL